MKKRLKGITTLEAKKERRRKKGEAEIEEIKRGIEEEKERSKERDIE
jgi:hypothetical protein